MSSTPVSEWKEVFANDMQWWIAPESHEVLFGPDGFLLGELLRTGKAAKVKQSPRRVVYRAELADSQAVFIKHHLLRGTRAWLRQIFRPSSGREELAQALALEAKGVATVVPIALGESRARFGTGESILVTRSLDSTQTLERLLLETLPKLPPTQQLQISRRITLELGRFVARLHQAGVFHADLHVGNILVRHVEPDAIHFYPIDLDGVRVGPELSWPESRDNLAIIGRWFMPRTSRAERLRFWRSYCSVRGAAFWKEQGIEPNSHARRIEDYVRAGEVAYWRHRDKRFFTNSREFRHVCAPGWSGHMVAEFSPKVLEELTSDPEAPFRRHDARILKDSPSSTVVEIIAEENGVNRWLIIKRIRPKLWTRGWASLVRRTPALRQWKFGHGLLERGLPTARPLLVLQSVDGQPSDAFLMSERIENATDLLSFVSHIVRNQEPAGRRVLRNAIDKVARTIRILHSYQMSHRDLKAANVLIEAQAGHDIPSLWLIDLNGVSIFRRMPHRRRIADLARLHASFHNGSLISRTDKLRFLRSYLLWNLHGKRNSNWKNWWREMEWATLRKIAKNRRRGRVLA